jgi:hypothetical protein
LEENKQQRITLKEESIPGQSRHLCRTPTIVLSHISHLTPVCTRGGGERIGASRGVTGRGGVLGRVGIGSWRITVVGTGEKVREGTNPGGSSFVTGVGDNNGTKGVTGINGVTGAGHIGMGTAGTGRSQYGPKLGVTPGPGTNDPPTLQFKQEQLTGS